MDKTRIDYLFKFLHELYNLSSRGCKCNHEIKNTINEINKEIKISQTTDGFVDKKLHVKGVVDLGGLDYLCNMNIYETDTKGEVYNFILKNKINNHPKLIQFILSAYNNTGKLVLTNDRQRSIGKTSTLVRVANWLELPIVVRNRSCMRYITDLFDGLGLEENVYIYTPSEILTGGVRVSENRLLLDEGIKFCDIQDLKDKNYRLNGFYYNNDLI